MASINSIADHPNGHKFREIAPNLYVFCLLPGSIRTDASEAAFLHTVHLIYNATQALPLQHSHVMFDDNKVAVTISDLAYNVFGDQVVITIGCLEFMSSSK